MFVYIYSKLVSFMCLFIWSSYIFLNLREFADCIYFNIGYAVQMLSRVRLFATPRIIAHEVPFSLGLSQQEYWSGLPFPHPGYLPHPGIVSTSLMSPSLASGFFIISDTWKALYLFIISCWSYFWSNYERCAWSLLCWTHSTE